MKKGKSNTDKDIDVNMNMDGDGDAIDNSTTGAGAGIAAGTKRGSEQITNALSTSINSTIYNTSSASTERIQANKKRLIIPPPSDNSNGSNSNGSNGHNSNSNGNTVSDDALQAMLCQPITTTSDAATATSTPNPNMNITPVPTNTTTTAAVRVPIEHHHSVLPLSMQLMKTCSALFCLNCNDNSRRRHHYDHFSNNNDSNQFQPQLLIQQQQQQLEQGLPPPIPVPVPAPLNANTNTNTANVNTTIANTTQKTTSSTTTDTEPTTTTTDTEPTTTKYLDQPHRFQHLNTIQPQPKSYTNQILQEYITTTQIYGCKHVNPGVLTAIRFSLPTLRITGSFHDSDMLALSEILFRHCNYSLKHIKRLDFSVPVGLKNGRKSQYGKRGFGSHGAFTLSRVIGMSHYIEEIFVQRNKIGPYGAASIFASVATNNNVKMLVMRRCSVGERGGLAFAEYVGRSEVVGLKEVDLSVNAIGFRGSIAIEEMLIEKEKNGKGMNVDLEGNLVLQEIMNGVTHGLGIVLCIIGAILLSNRVKHAGYNHKLSCGVYSFSLLVLYTSSTLFHSFFALKYTRYIFEVLDHCAIYILITGSYTPFLRIALYENEPITALFLVMFQWTCCFAGIFVEAFYNDWIHKPKFSLAMYLGMGWSALVVLPQFMEILPKEAIHLIILGGVGYTSGVPFFVRNNNLDHSIWHCFVLAGSICHWLAVYLYVAPMAVNMDMNMNSMNMNMNTNMNMTCTV